ncbi:phage/plasmid primase, P4 family [Streptococcus anginosus]|jgi:phage/plasmid primase, P4 family, C-terminal domain|uniref:Phage/plasmid primase, P4 family n=1 Tax=Streptococcus anginosus TaxID=1328 RepID=A0ABT3E9N1_STRAP|nr:phage/plasmid primase, P4 family [Streptococcus anginosus]EGV04305.1 D5-like N-terminal domain protein [Streptococcus infantis SK970]QBX16648.1 DNA primase/helicase [Streptococcus phage Javan269]MCW0977890.1 phage/plasmid primase, P4 family [Streptococcus anginosus]MCW0992955.1 phage/plasmid primase, P4 family [Streptococcus anginosus]MCW0995592.1 phage/plasmid primase, P4 family [Streptococcus anginosus]
MQFSLCHSGKTGIQTSTVYPNKVRITDDKSLLNTVQYDHVGAEFTNHTRSNSNFIKSDVIVMDIDNDKTDNPNEWVTEENLKEIFIDYDFALVTSRNHMLSKGAMIARPKFHIYFPIKETNDREAYVAMKEELTNRYQFFDDNAKDAARFFFGNPNAKVIWNDSWMTIDEGLLQEVEEDFDADFYRSPKRPIAEGSRNSTMSVFAAKILKRLGVTQEARSGFDEQASRCEPPLEKSELDTIWGSAVRFYNKTIKSSDDYISPDSFNRPSLKPDDFSDIGEAGVLAREYGDVLAYTNATDYLTFNGQYWKEDKQLAIGKVLEFMDFQLADTLEQYEKSVIELVNSGIDESVVREGGKALAKVIETPIQQKLYSIYLSSKTYYQFVMKRRDYRYITATHNTAKPMLAIDLSELDKDDMLLNTPNATYNLRNGLRDYHEHDPKDYITKITTVSPGDEGLGLWKETLATFFCNDQELIDYVQEIIGMTAIGKVYQEHMIIAYGGGANGKSTFWNTIARVLGSYSGKLSADALTMNNKRNVSPELAELKGKRLVIASEMAEGMRLNTAVVKQITSTDEIQAEKKYKDPFHFVPSHTLVLYTNHLPKVGANDDGTWRRLVVIPFNAKISGRSDIKNFADYLYDNAGPAILSWIIEGAEKAIKANFKTSVPKAVTNSVKSYREANDWLGHFITESCEVGEKLSEKSGELYSKYRAYCLQNLEYTRSTTDFYAALNQAGYERKRTNKGNFIMGLSLKADDDDFLN